MLLELSENGVVGLPVCPRHDGRTARKRTAVSRWLVSPHIAATLDPNKTRTNRPMRAQITDVIHYWHKDNFIITFAVTNNNNLRV